MKKIFVIIVALLLCVLFLPFPTYRSYHLFGVPISRDYKTDDSVKVEVQGWYFDYLLFRDKWNGTVIISDDSDQKYEMMGSVLDNRDGILFVSITHYDKDKNYYTPGYLFFNYTFDMFMLDTSSKNNDYIVFGKTQSTPIEIFHYFEDILDMN